ncbi:hypothetical protein [Streptomyces turgidiscabies]|uniref:Dioxygenase n=1 Tax=Streptomyces turgidiscabies TaxID=85558 RepID=A0ABU0RYG7_9ACTN|nr:hypothetical protein [Streptomyces turgidiscabies]MDQ0936888.1 hypothetical protein [Streptomyces turgidiscabies]
MTVRRDRAATATRTEFSTVGPGDDYALSGVPHARRLTTRANGLNRWEPVLEEPEGGHRPPGAVRPRHIHVFVG